METGVLRKIRLIDPVRPPEEIVMEVKTGAYLDSIQVPSRQGYSFDGWFFDPEATQRCAVFAARVMADMTLYAGWTEAETDYTPYYLDARAAECHFLAYNDASSAYLNKVMYDYSVRRFSYDAMLDMARNTPEEFRPWFEQLRFAVRELVQIHPESYRCYDLWSGTVPKVAECEVRSPRAKAYLQDDPEFRPFLIDMRLPEPETAKGTVIINPSVRAARPELLDTARLWQSMGYNCFAISPRFNTLSRNPFDPQSVGFFGSYSYPELLLDCQRAIRYLRYHAKELGIDPERFVTLGFSKGNCIHFVSSNLFNVTPLQLHFMKNDGSWSELMSGYEEDEIDRVSAHAAVNLVVYGDMMLCPDMKDPAICQSPIYSPENRDRGLLYPACYFLIGNYDMVNLQVAGAFHTHNSQEDRLYDIPYELHICDKVPHGVCVGKQYPTYYHAWAGADLFCQMNFIRSREPRPKRPY